MNTFLVSNRSQIIISNFEAGFEKFEPYLIDFISFQETDFNNVEATKDFMQVPVLLNQLQPN